MERESEGSGSHPFVSLDDVASAGAGGGEHPKTAHSMRTTNGNVGPISDSTAAAVPVCHDTASDASSPLHVGCNLLDRTSEADHGEPSDKDKLWLESLKMPLVTTDWGEFTGLHKLCYTDPMLNEGRETVEWYDVQRYLKFAPDAEKRAALTMKQSPCGWTPLSLICRSRPPTVVVEQMLHLDDGSMNLAMATDNGGYTALHHAYRFGASKGVVRLLLDAGKKDLAMAKEKCGKTALHWSCQYGAPVRHLLDSGGKDLVMAKDRYGNTALHSACCYGRSFVVIWLLLNAGGKDLVMAKNQNGETALHCALRNQASDLVVKLLLDVGGKDLAMAKDRNGKMALHRESRYYGAIVAIRILLNARWKDLVTTRNETVETALCSCQRRFSEDVIRPILDDVWDNDLVMTKDKDVKAALQFACCHQTEADVVRLPFNAGGNDLLMAKNKYGDTVLRCALRLMQRKRLRSKR